LERATKLGEEKNEAMNEVNVGYNISLTEDGNGSGILTL
jgi:hypothetical protein